MKLDKQLQITEELREQLKRPIGKLIPGREENLSEAVEIIKRMLHSRSVKGLIITVGDIVAKSFNEGHLLMDIAIVDFQVKRVETFKNLSEIGFSKKEPDVTVENPKGTLTPATFTAVKKASRQGGTLEKEPPYIIRIIGEEDLATLAAVLVASLGTHVFYGQPNEGIVDVAVTEEKKTEIRGIVSKFH